MCLKDVHKNYIKCCRVNVSCLFYHTSHSYASFSIRKDAPARDKMPAKCKQEMHTFIIAIIISA